MIEACPLCSQKSVTPVFALESAPLVPFVLDPATPRQSITAPLDIVSCGHCGHMFNRAFSKKHSTDMYAVDFLMNRPVHPSMHSQLEHIANRLDRRLVSGKRVLEIGAGTGHFARILATEAESVTVIEPSRALSKESLPEANINLVTDFFAPKFCTQPFDLIICRQVLEHVVDPVSMLCEMCSALSSDGVIYLEVPRAEYIEENLAIIELHNAHVQYFRERTFFYPAARAGLEVSDSWHLKSGHDMGFLLRASSECNETIPPPSKMPDDLRDSFTRKRATIDTRLRSISGRGGLYGANWQGTSFYWLYSESMATTEAVLDDNDNYPGFHFISPRRSVPIRKPESALLSGLDYLVITAHLHSKAIAERVRTAGFRGRLFEAVSLTER